MTNPPEMVTVAHSPDSDDAFMFYALATNKVGLPGIKFKHVLSDIEDLNRRDEIDGILRLSRSSEHAPVNIGNPTEWTILDCAKAILRVTGSKSAIVQRPLPQDDPSQRQPDISKARRLLKWEPKIDLETGLKLSLDYFRTCVEAAA